jgi:hypothetical protein
MENDMIDFTKLRRPSAAERREQEQRRRAAEIADDHTRRLFRSPDCAKSPKWRSAGAVL